MRKSIRSRFDNGKTSSVHFLRFALTDAEATAFRDVDTSAMIGCDHSLHGHQAVLGPETRAEPAKDLA